MNNRPFLRDVAPRFYKDVEDFLREHYPAILPQLQHLYVTDRCTCGADHCAQFFCDSNSPEFAPLSGRRPLYHDIEGCEASVSFGLSNDSVLTGFEITYDYPDSYLHQMLVAHGFHRNTEL